MPNGILVVLEQREGAVKAQSLQTLSKAGLLAGDMGAEVYVLLIGAGASALEELKGYKIDKALVVDSAELASYKNASYAEAVAKAVKNLDPKLVLYSATAMGKDLAPLAAAKAGCCLVSDVVEVSFSDGSVLVKKPIYAGKCFANLKAKSFPVMLSLRPNVFAAEKAGAGEFPVESLDISLSAQDPRSVEYIEPETVELDVAEANIIVAGGRGLKAPENLDKIRNMAKALGAAVGASRAIVDADWISHEHQVGQTGKTVSPNLYIAVGISGAIQHLAGMSSSKYIVAINKDADAPIFKAADFGIVGDLFDVVDKITEGINKAKA